MSEPTNDESQSNDDQSPPLIPVRDAEQIRRARILLDAAAASKNPDAQFVLTVGALHLARAVPEYWFTTAEQIPIDLHLDRSVWKSETKRLRGEFDEEFIKARRFTLLTSLRQWDFHWEPIRDARTVPPNMRLGSGAPMRLSTGKQPNSVAALIGGKLVTTGSGARIGRANQYDIQQSRYVDPDRPEALPLALAIQQFLEDLPACIAEILKKPDVQQYIKSMT